MKTTRTPERRWREMGEPEYLSAREQEQLHAASRTVQERHMWKLEGQNIHMEIELPPHAVAALTVEFAPAL